MTDETRARFLAGIAAQIPADRVQELHLFGAIRQAGMESGIAVIAVAREPDVPDEVASAEGQSEAAVAEPAAAPRYIVYTARYRHTLKGPDRGKWEMSVTEEADAPLLTVDAVVRGVSRRSGDADETVRLSGDEFRAALHEPARS
jgi:hypothetical protein